MRTSHASDRDLTLELKEYTDGESLEKFETRLVFMEVFALFRLQSRILFSDAAQ